MNKLMRQIVTLPMRAVIKNYSFILTATENATATVSEIFNHHDLIDFSVIIFLEQQPCVLQSFVLIPVVQTKMQGGSKRF